ncbi:hypothetical protein ACJMK2_011746, partial [Sinanodonta woodiana]
MDPDLSDIESNEDRKKYINDISELSKCGWGGLSLRTYQLAGTNWLINCYYQEHGCILGDEMGLGKTCQTIALIVYLHHHEKSSKPSLVVCPRSVLENWEQEFKRFAPGLNVKCYIGDKDKRTEIAMDIKADRSKGIKPFEVLLTTYEICLKDYLFLGKLPWHVLAVDEAHRLKNQDSQLFQTLSLWKFREPVLLTGTPVQNNLDELYSLLSFVHSERFPAWKREKFLNKYSNVDEEEDVSELHKLLKPYLLRRTKSAVLKDLPKKSEIVIYHGITKLQRDLYKAILTKDIDLFDCGSSSYSGGTRSLMNILMQLRKCVNHPYLFDGVEPEPFELGEHLVESSGKLILIDCLLKYLKSTGHKVLMFSQMTHMLDVLQDYMGYRGYTYERLDGSVRGEERFLAVQNFNQNEETFVFLLSTKAGGQGLNLTGADTVIFVDSDFNPQNDLQAAARAHRIGQTRPVKIIRLIGQNTVEEIILKRAEIKLKLSEKVIEEGEFSLGMSKQGRQELITDDKVKLQDILKFGVNELLNEENSCSAVIDFVKILGPSVDGEWQLSEATVAEQSTSESMGKEEKSEDEEEENVEPPQSMYMFEGMDYSKEPTAADIKAFEELVAAERAALELKATAEKGLRKRQTTVLMGPLPEIIRKPRKKLTAEELEERKKKRQENAERRAKEEEDKERKRKEELWRANSYTSCNISIESDSDQEEEEEAKEEKERNEEEGEVPIQPTKRDIHYVIGDVTHPQDTGSDINIIVHCADDSGKWGRGGIFTAITARSELPQQKYDLAGWMKDLELGDCHLFPMDDKNVEMLGLIIAQHRDRKNNLSGIHLSALSQGLKRIYHVAKSRK